MPIKIADMDALYRKGSFQWVRDTFTAIDKLGLEAKPSRSSVRNGQAAGLDIYNSPYQGGGWNTIFKSEDVRVMYIFIFLDKP